MLTVTTPATNTRLTSIEAVRAMYGMTTSQLDDAGVETLIDRASAAVVSYCNRPFARETVRQVEYLTSCVPSITMERMQAVVSSVEVTEGSTALVRDTDFVVNEEVWSLYRLSGTSRREWSPCTLTITYQAGYTVPADGADYTLPKNVEDACLRLVGDGWKVVQGQTGGVLKRERIEGVGEWEWFMPGSASQLSNPVSEMLLADFRRITF